MRATRWLSSVVGMLGLLACNEILDNRKGIGRETTVESTTDATQPAGGSGDAATPPASSSAPVPATDADAPGPQPPPEPANPCGNSKFCSGACVSLDDANHGCGATGCAPCAIDGANATCVNGACSLGSCQAGRANCDGLAPNGCETDITLPTSCAACGAVCPTLPNAAPACSNGHCTLACAPGFDNCNGDPADGCETDLTDDRANCGLCNRPCAIGPCVAGECKLF